MCPHNKKQHFGYQFPLFFLPKCKWMWEKNEAQLQPSKSCQEKIGESSVHADTLIPQGKRPHSSQRAKKLQPEIAESSVHVSDGFCASTAQYSVHADTLLREAAAQFTASQETTARNCREFRLCHGLFFVHRPHSTQQSNKNSLRKSTRIKNQLRKC